MRKIVEITARSSAGGFALLPALLAYAKHAGKDIVGPGKHVAGIVKDYWTEILLEEGQRKRRHAQLKLIQKESVASHWETGLQIARPSLVEREPAQRIGTTAVKPLSQRHDGVGKWILRSHTGIA